MIEILFAAIGATLLLNIAGWSVVMYVLFKRAEG